jgi:hypothetical protein
MPFKDPDRKKEYQREYHKRHYQKYKDAYKKKAVKRNRSQRKWCREFVSRVKSKLACTDCGEGDPVVLDFDHVHGDKEHNISDMVNGSYSIAAIKKEMRKCEVRCSNCHRKKTHQRRNQ